MKCFVTGASGFVGANLVHELVARGHQVKVLMRPQADDRGLRGVEVKRVVGDVLDLKALAEGVEGCEWVFHVAASYHLWMRNYDSMYQANVEGTRNVLHTAAKSGALRIVYTSTVGCIGYPQLRDGVITPSTEVEPALEGQLSSHYKRSKYEAEGVAVEAFRKHGFPVIIVNPSAPIGPRDVKPTPTGRIIVDYLNGKMPAYIETGLNWVHVRDVAIGHILAAEKGDFGERYILGNQDGNWTMKETFEQLAAITGIPAPRVKIPHWLAMGVAGVSEFGARFTGKEPRATKAGVKMAQSKMWFNPAKAIRTLGLPQTPPRQALIDAVEWFRANGYVKKKS
jgi:dihydroflavonol-4-reductase